MKFSTSFIGIACMIAASKADTFIPGGSNSAANATLKEAMAINLCATTTATCKLACSNTEPVVNSCDTGSLKWDCECKAGTNQTIPNYSFPIEYSACQSAYTSCVTGCLSQKSPAESGPCAGKCSVDFKCGTSSAPDMSSKTHGKNGTVNANTSSASHSMLGSVGIMGLTVVAGFMALM